MNNLIQNPKKVSKSLSLQRQRNHSYDQVCEPPREHLGQLLSPLDRITCLFSIAYMHRKKSYLGKRLRSNYVCRNTINFHCRHNTFVINLISQQRGGQFTCRSNAILYKSLKPCYTSTRVTYFQGL